MRWPTSPSRFLFQPTVTTAEVEERDIAGHPYLGLVRAVATLVGIRNLIALLAEVAREDESLTLTSLLRSTVLEAQGAIDADSDWLRRRDRQTGIDPEDCPF
jgi:hypothetical protein